MILCHDATEAKVPDKATSPKLESVKTIAA
jgi:hypothetical protein